MYFSTFFLLFNRLFTFSGYNFLWKQEDSENVFPAAKVYTLFKKFTPPRLEQFSYKVLFHPKMRKVKKVLPKRYTNLKMLQETLLFNFTFRHNAVNPLWSLELFRPTFDLNVCFHLQKKFLVQKYVKCHFRHVFTETKMELYIMQS